MADMPVMPDPIVKSIVEPISPVIPDPIVDPIGLDAIEGDPIGVDSIGTDPEPAILDSIGTGLSPLGSELSVAPVPAEVIIGAPVVIATTVTVGASVPGSTVDSPCSAKAVLISTSSSTAALYLAVSSTIKASWVTTTWVARVEAEVFLASRSATSSEVHAGSRLLEVVTTKMLTMTRALETLYVLVLLASKASAMLTRAVFTSSQVDTLRTPLADEGTKLAVSMESRPVLAASACAFVSVAAAIAAAAASFVALAAAACAVKSTTDTVGFSQSWITLVTFSAAFLQSPTAFLHKDKADLTLSDASLILHSSDLMIITVLLVCPSWLSQQVHASAPALPVHSLVMSS